MGERTQAFNICLPIAFILILSYQFNLSLYLNSNHNLYASQHVPQAPNESEEIAVPLPSIIISKEESKVDRDIYGGVGDKPHLGGFTNIDYMGLSPAAWNLMIKDIGVKSVLDVGCGKGVSTSYFLYQGLEVSCVEGSHDAVTQTIIPPNLVVEHDFSRGPWWPSKTVDAVWCVEFLEHVGRNFHKNYFPAFKKAALIFASHSNWGGWHHVEVHNDDWWITKFQMFGLTYSKYLTQMVRSAAQAGRDKKFHGKEVFNGQHIWTSMMVFVNPEVASLPQHGHLLAEPGCYKGMEQGKHVNRECGKKMETPLPESFKPMEVDNDKFKEWKKFVVTSLNLNKTNK